jgi:hypothetical protein
MEWTKISQLHPSEALGYANKTQPLARGGNGLSTKILGEFALRGPVPAESTSLEDQWNDRK